MVSPDTLAPRNDVLTRPPQDSSSRASAPTPSSTRPRRCGSASRSLPSAGISKRVARSPLAPSTTRVEIVASANGAPDPVTSGPDVLEETLMTASVDRLRYACSPPASASLAVAGRSLRLRPLTSRGRGPRYARRGPPPVEGCHSRVPPGVGDPAQVAQDLVQMLEPALPDV